MPIGGRPFGRAPLGGTGFSPAGQAGVLLKIGAIDVTPMLRWPGIRTAKELNARDDMEVELITTTGYVPALGEQITLLYNGGIEFLGTIHSRDIAFLSEADDLWTEMKLRCVDLNELADRHLVIDIFENRSAGTIVRQIVTKYLAADNIQIGDVQEGPFVTRFVAAYLTIAQCLNELCEQSGFHWNIDASRTLNFRARTTAPAPFTITQSNAVFKALRGTRTKNQFRNVQYLDGGKGVTDPRTENFPGDGTTRTFNVEYPLFEAPTITRDGAVQSVGIRGVDENKDWYWNKGETALGHDPERPVLIASEAIQVLYRGTFDLVGIVEDVAAIQERREVEGGSGRYEHLHRDDGIDGEDNVQDKAISLLRQFSTLDDSTDFETFVPGLAIGQLATLDVVELLLQGDFLITKLETEFIEPNVRRFQVSATTGDVKGRYQEFFAQMLSSKRTVALRDGETLQEALVMHDLVGVTDSIEATLVDVVADEFGPGEFGPGEFGP